MKRKLIIISILILISIILVIPKSYGAIALEPTIMENGKEKNPVIVHTTISNSYSLCQQMTKNGESLYGTTVKPHLATNKDWGAVSYLSNSAYGTNREGKNTGVTTTINGVDYYSTTGNASGVMNWGSNPNKTLYTQTAGIIKAYMDLSEADRLALNSYVTALATAADSNSPYVEILKTQVGSFSGPTIGMALSETSQYSFLVTKIVYPQPQSPSVLRKGLFEYNVGCGSPLYPDGTSKSNNTFRPVVWN